MKAGGGLNVQITGIKELDEALKKLEGKEARKVIRSAMRKGLQPMRDKAIELAPVGISRLWRGKQHEAGELRKAIKIRAAKARKRGTINLTVRIGEGDFKGEQFYASFPEYGTVRQPAQSFMRRAFDATKDQVRDDTNNLIREGVNRLLRWWQKV